MKRIGIMSYNIHCNFTNYGSALQSWALSESIKKLGYYPVLIDYCPDILADKDPLNPMKNMWDKDENLRKLCELSLPAIKENYKKFDNFYTNSFNRSKAYTSKNFNNIIIDEQLDGFVCGSDTIFCIDEFGFDDGYYANYDVMKNNSVSYAASFGDSHFDEKSYKELDKRLMNFKSIGIREKGMIPYIEKRVNVPVKKVLDPTLLLETKDYEKIITKSNKKEKYVLLYLRRNNPNVNKFAEKIAKENNLKIIEISLNALNKNVHEMAYEAGVEEFLGLIKDAEYVVTNSFHGMIFAVQFRKQFVIFSREQCDTKIEEVLDFLGLGDRLLINGDEIYKKEIDYDNVHKRIKDERKKSIEFLKNSLDMFDR